MIEPSNELLLDCLGLLAFACTLRWAVFAIRRLSSGAGRPVYFLIIVHFVFCGLPGLLDVVFGRPEYLGQPGFYDGSRDLATNVIYTLYVSLCPLVWILAFRRQQTSAGRQVDAGPTLRFAWLPLVYGAIMLTPFLAWALSPQRGRYFSYGAALHTYQDEQMASWHGLISLTCMLAVLATAGLLLRTRSWSLPLLLFVSFTLFATCWMHGKRSIIAITMLMVGYVLWERGVLRGRRLIAASVLATLLFAGFSLTYQTTLRGGRGTISEYGVYQNVRIDYGRDDVIKMTIHAELNPEQRQILEYRGQSLLFYATIWVPRISWPEKPWPYAVYFTSAMLNMPRIRYLDWGMTTSWLEEAISNFGWLGMLIAPFSLALVCHLGWRRQDSQTTFLTLLVVSLLMTVHLSAFFAVFLLWVARVVVTGRWRILPVQGSRQTRSPRPLLAITDR